MLVLRTSGARFGTTVCLLVLAAGLACGRNGRDFAGFYQIKDAADQGLAFKVRFAIRVFNYSDADATQATLTLANSLSPRRAYGSFTQVSIPRGGDVVLSGNFAVPLREYKRWQRGGAPELIIQFQDDAGKTVRRSVELTRRPLGEEN